MTDDDTPRRDADALARAGREAGLALAAQAEPHLDLAQVAAESEYLMEHLSARYEEALAPVLADGSDADRLALTTRLLVRQLARAQADIHVLKAAVLGRDRLAMTEDWTYRDPLRAHFGRVGRDMTRARAFPLGRYELHPEASMLGYGWHGIEEKPGQTPWRWSGPDPRAGLLLPNLMGGPCRITLELQAFLRELVPDEGLVRVEEAPVPYEAEWRDETKFSVGFDVDPAPDAANVLVELRVTRTASPAEVLGRYDKRKLGVSLRKIVYEAPGDGSDGAGSAT